MPFCFVINTKDGRMKIIVLNVNKILGHKPNKAQTLVAIKLDFLPPLKITTPAGDSFRSPTGKIYVQTNRSVRTITGASPSYPTSFFNPAELKGKDVLDVGTGGGNLVLDMRGMGAKAVGIDIQSHLNHAKYPDFFKIADAKNTGFISESFDMIYSSWSVFSYAEKFNFKVEVLTELKRILKKGGKVRLGAISPHEIKKVAKEVGAFEVTVCPPIPLLKRLFPKTQKMTSWIELTKK